MQEEDYETLRAEAQAEPTRYSTWDSQRQFRRDYEERHGNDTTEHAEVSHHREEVEAPLSRTSSSASSSSASTVPDTPERSRPQTRPIRSGSGTIGPARTAGSYYGSLYRHPTETDPEALRRIETSRTQHLGTVGSTVTKRTTKPLPPMGANKPYPPQLPEREEYVVEYDGADDPLHAQNWPLKKKLFVGAILAFDAFTATMGSSIFAPAIAPVSKEFHVGQEVGTLGTSFFVFGYAFGPLLWAPFSELYGRRPPIVLAAFGYSIFAIAVAVGKDLQTILICRFFSGIFGSCPLAVVAAIFADMFDNKTRGLAVAVFSSTVFMGPLLAPFIGGFITISYLGWRWTEYISSIMGWTALVLLFFFLEETYPPVVLVNKAAELRRRTRNWGIHAKQEEIEVDFKELIVKNVSRPMRILFTETIVLLLTLYLSFIYGLLYLFLTAYALVFQGVYGWNAGVGGLAYFGMITGEIIAFTVMVCMNPAYIRKLEANKNIPVPEWRLPMAIVGGVFFAAGLFWFGWTGYQGSIHWIVPLLSGLFTGFGIFSIFLSLLNYLVDAYLMFAASAMAANTFMRSLFGGIFPLFAKQMFQGMGIQWAATLLGCVALVLVPMPVLFFYFGKRIRATSKFAPAPDIELDKQRARERDEEASAGVGVDVGASGLDSEGSSGMVGQEGRIKEE